MAKRKSVANRTIDGLRRFSELLGRGVPLEAIELSVSAKGDVKRKHVVLEPAPKMAVAGPPKLKWVATAFEDEFDCRVGVLCFTATTDGLWEVDFEVRENGRIRSELIFSGRVKTLSAAKRKCQAVFDRQWRAMHRLL